MIATLTRTPLIAASFSHSDDGSAPFPRLARTESPAGTNKASRDAKLCGAPEPLRLDPTLPETCEEQDPERWDGLS